MTPHERNPILHAPAEYADYVTCRTCAKCDLYEVSLSCPCCGADVSGDVGMCGERGDPVEVDDQRTGSDAECWVPR